MISPSTLIDTWDAGTRRHPIDRALLLLSLSGAAPPESLPDVPLGELNRDLMHLRRERFGNRLSVWADCAGCGERMSMELAVDDLPAAAEVVREIEVRGHRFRRPTSRDLAAVARMPDAVTAARALCRACAASPDTLPEGEALDALLLEVEAALDDADPWADLTLLAECPACGHREAVELDVAGLLWDEIAATAQRLLEEVHALAAAYGWSEREILAMSEARRAAYVARVVA